MTFHRALATLAIAGLTCLASATAAQAKTFLGFLPTPGLLSEDEQLQGPLNFSLGSQTLPGRPSIVGMDFTGTFDKSEVALRLAFDPKDFTSFMAADAYASVVGQTGSFLPLNLMPMMGIGAGMYLLAPAGSTDSLDIDAATPIYVPMGLRYALPIGPFTAGVTAMYFHQLMDYSSNRAKFDASRWHYEGTLRWGGLTASVYTEDGPFLSGPGFKVGLNF